jgi:hypothetical protein
MDFKKATETVKDYLREVYWREENHDGPPEGRLEGHYVVLNTTVNSAAILE